MKVCQTSIKKNQNTKAIRPPLRQLVIIVEQHSGKLQPLIIARKDIFAVKVAIRLTAERLCHPMSNHLGEVVLAIQKLINDGKQKIPNEWHFSRLGDMLGREVQRAAILLRNGLNSKRGMVTAALSVANAKNLPKTISFHYLKVAPTISQIFNLFVVTATAKNGSTRLGYFNIYSNPELLEADR